MSDLDEALFLAVQAHSGQKDRFGSPYILHPLRMMVRMTSDEEKIVAVLHDAVEKTPLTLDDLRGKKFTEDIIDAVDRLTKRENEPYEKHIERASANPISLKVKLADLEDNMAQARAHLFSEKEEKRLQRFQKAKDRLEKILGFG